MLGHLFVEEIVVSISLRFLNQSTNILFSLSVTQELQGLEALEYQMARNLEALRERRDRAKFAFTLKGKLFNLGGRLFATYCVVRVLNVGLKVNLNQCIIELSQIYSAYTISHICRLNALHRLQPTLT